MGREGVHTLGPLADWKRLHTVDGMQSSPRGICRLCRYRPRCLLRAAAGKEQLVNGDCSCLPGFPLWSHYVMCFWAVEDLFLSPGNSATWTLHRTLTAGHDLPFSAVGESALSPVWN